MMSFAPQPIGSPVKGSRQLCCRGVELKPINYQLLALRCGQRSLVGNGFIRSAVMVSSAPTGRATAKKRIGISVDAPLKKCSAYGADIITPHLPQAASSPQAPQGEDNWVRPKTQHRTNATRGNHGFLCTLDTGQPEICVSVQTQCASKKARGNYGFLRSLEPGYRNMRIRRCGNAPLKRRYG